MRHIKFLAYKVEAFAVVEKMSRGTILPNPALQRSPLRFAAGRCRWANLFKGEKLSSRQRERAMNRKTILAITLVQFFWLTNIAIAETPNEDSFDSKLSLYTAVCNTSLIGRQAEMTDKLLIMAKDDFHKWLLLAGPLSRTTLVGRQAQVFDELISASWEDLRNLLLVAEPLSYTTLTGRQAQVFDKLIIASWNDRERLLKVMEVLSHTKLVGRQNQVLERLEELEVVKKRKQKK